MIDFSCPKCTFALTRHNNEAGSKVSCPSCGQRVQVPRPPQQTDQTVMGELVCPEQLAPTVIGELVLPVEVGTSSRTLRCVCPNCQATIKAKAYRAGTTVNCPQCKIPFDIPISSADQFEVGSQPLRPAH